MSDPIPPLAALQERLGYRFRDSDLLERAVTHRSYLTEHPEAAENNQRLEFLGDTVLQFILTETLFHLYPDEREGVLSKRRATLVKGAFLAGMAREIQLDRCLRVSASEEAAGRQRTSALEDAFEALVGALYLDGGLPAARQVVMSLYGDPEKRLASLEQEENPKGRLQELVQPRHGNDALRYEVTGIQGEDHAREYVVAVFLHDRRLGTGRGPSKRVAEEAAAREALETLRSTEV